MPVENNGYFSIGIILFVEITIILLIVLFVCILHIHILFRLKRDKIAEKGLRDILLKVLTENQPLNSGVVQPYLYSLPIVTQVIRDLNRKIKGATWLKIKEQILKEKMGKEIYRSLISRNWKRRSWALQALALFPNHEVEERVISLLKDKIPAVRFSAATCLIQMKTQNGVNRLLEVMAEEETYARYPYRDLLVTGDSEIYTYVANQFQVTKELKVRICALEVLSQKIGFIHVDLLKKDLESNDLELKWWALRALENCPSDESIAILEKHAKEEKDERLRSIAIQSLGVIMDRGALPLFEKLLTDKSQVIRNQAAIALKKLGRIGISVLKNQSKEKNIEAFNASQIALTLPEKSIEEQSVKWFRYY